MFSNARTFTTLRIEENSQLKEGKLLMRMIMTDIVIDSAYEDRGRILPANLNRASREILSLSQEPGSRAPRTVSIELVRTSSGFIDPVDTAFFLPDPC